MGDRFGLAENLDAEARWQAAAGEPRRALLLHGAADALREQTGPLWPVERQPLEDGIAALRDALGSDADAAWDEGRAAAAPDRSPAEVARDLLGS
jgi:hypothetical protein